MNNIKYDFGMVGLGTMGSNLLLNMSDHGFSVIGYDKNPAQIKKLEEAGGNKPTVKGVDTAEKMVSALKHPRIIMMLVPAGKPVDSVISDLLPFLSKGDIIIDGGNSHYIDTLTRIKTLNDSGIHFMGIGISGGEDGARNGPSIMPGGDKTAYGYMAPILEAISAKVNGEPCVAYLGLGAAGHYVKMVHNGIEYAIMQSISECYDILKNGVHLNNDELSQVFQEWNKGELKSFLLEITALIFKKKDDSSQGFLVDKILDKAGAKGTGQWTSESGLDLPMPIPTIDSAVMMRTISSRKDERIKLHQIYRYEPKKIEANKDEFIKELKDAFYFTMMISYIQGLAIIEQASSELNMNIPLHDVVKVWRGGCIIRSEMLPLFMDVFKSDVKNVLENNAIKTKLLEKLPAIKSVISKAVNANFPPVAMMSSLGYFNSIVREKLPTNLIQAQRDFFGAHTYQRNDKEGIFHTIWETVL